MKVIKCAAILLCLSLSICLAASVSGIIKRTILSLGTGAATHTVTSGESRSHLSGVIFHFSNSVTTEVRVNLIIAGDTNRIFTQALTAGKDVSFFPDGEVGLLVGTIIEAVSTNAQDGVVTITLSR